MPLTIDNTAVAGVRQIFAKGLSGSFDAATLEKFLDPFLEQNLLDLSGVRPEGAQMRCNIATVDTCPESYTVVTKSKIRFCYSLEAAKFLDRATLKYDEQTATFSLSFPTELPVASIRDPHSVPSNWSAELGSLVGIQQVKTAVREFASLVEVRQARAAVGLPVASAATHFIFRGNPGTGKTTVARILGGVLNHYGILKKGHVVETDRAHLVGQYVGQTAPLVDAKVNEALDGILFVDEAYSLWNASENDYGREAVNTLLKRMEDLRERLVVVVAGYPSEMDKLIGMNPGLQSRFTHRIDFDDLGPDELYEVFVRMADKYHYQLSIQSDVKLRQMLARLWEARDEKFGNARTVRNLFEQILAAQSVRLTSQRSIYSRDNLCVIEEADIPSSLH